MQTNSSSQWGLSHPRVLAVFALCSAGVLLAMFSFAGTAPAGAKAIGLTSAKPNMAGSNAPAPELAMGSWGVVASPNASILRVLDAVTCVSATDCWAVGYARSDSGIDQTLAEHWNGTSWTVFPSANSSGTQRNYLEDVTCIAGNDCWAVGTYQNDAGTNQTLIEHWNGTLWSIVSSPNPSAVRDNFLHGVSCNTATDCWAVGHFVNAGGFQQTVIERWDGTSWTIATSANTSASQDNNLQSVACTGPSNCRAVGYFVNASGFQQTLTERWNGTNWAIAVSPNTSATQHNVLKSLTCVSGTLCRAVGYYVTAGGFQQTLIERWNGTNWAIVTSPNTSVTSNNVLQSVVCTNANNCRAVGYSTNAGGFKQTLIQHWNGTDWSIIPSPNAPSSDNNNLTGVACSSGANCWAVGTFTSGSALEEPLIEHWDGTGWSIASMAILQFNFLNGVTCVSSSDCWAVGYYFNGGGHQQTLIEHWNGTAWAKVSSPNSSSTEANVLYGVACNSSSDCWAAGSSTEGAQTLFEHWNGAAWTIVSSPSAGQSNSLNDITCVSATDCWAVGSYSNASFEQTLIEHWDGKSWSIAASLNASTHSNVLYGVACAAASDCWTVGSYFREDGPELTLIEHWNGSSWSIIDSPNPGGEDINRLREVTCSSSSDCWSVGSYVADVSTGVNQTLIAHWDGTSWTTVASPNTSASQNNHLNGVTCALDDYCWAVGDFFNGSAYATLTEQWDGNTWSIVTSPNGSANDNHLYDVACSSALECWAVGDFSNGSPPTPQTLIERFNLTAPLFRSAVSRITHGDAGPFDINLPLTGTPGVECRIDGAAAGEYTLIFKFEPDLTSVAGAAVTSGAGSVDTRMIDPKDAHNYIVHLTGVTNQQTITVTLTNVNDSAGHSSAAVSVSMAVLLGDVTGNRTVNSTDVSQAQFESGHTVTIDNFRADVTANGTINSSDVSTVQAQSGTGL